MAKSKTSSSKKKTNKSNVKKQTASNKIKNTANNKNKKVTKTELKENVVINNEKETKGNSDKKRQKNNKKVKTTITKNDSEIAKLIKIVLIVTAIMVVFYGITLAVTKNTSSSESSKNSNNEKAVIQYDDIMIGTMLNKSQDAYYVLIKEDDDNRIVEYETLMKLIAAKTDAPKIYTANLTDSFNKKYLAKEANDSSNMEEFRVSGTTLVEIKEGKIANIYSNHESIREKLDALTK